MKQFLSTIAVIALAVILFVTLVFGGGHLGLQYKATFGKANKDLDREIFKQSVTYNEGVVDDLAKYKLDMIKAEDDIEKAAIAELVVSRFANYDDSKIEDKDLKQFLKDCRNGEYAIKKEGK